MDKMFDITNPEVKLLVELAKECETVDPIDWSDLNISEDQAYAMMAAHVLEMQDDRLTRDAILVKMLVENFVLNLKLLGKK